MSDNRNHQTWHNIEGRDKTRDMFDRGFAKLYKFTMWVMLVLTFIGAVYFTTAYIQNKATIKQMEGMWEMFGCLAVVKLLSVGIQYLVERRWQKAENYAPGQAKLPRESKRSLNQTLTYMAGKPMLLVWDIIWPIFIFSMVIGFSGDAAHAKAAARSIVYMFVILIVGHIFFVIYYKFRSYRRKLLKYTRKYMNVGDEVAFCEALDQNLREKMLYRSRRFAMSQDYLMGYTRMDGFFEPAAIPIAAVTAAEFSIRRNYGKVTRDTGMLTCMLSNGNKIVFCTSQGSQIEEVKRVLNYYGFAYQIR